MKKQIFSCLLATLLFFAGCGRASGSGESSPENGSGTSPVTSSEATVESGSEPNWADGVTEGSDIHIFTLEDDMNLQSILAMDDPIPISLESLAELGPDAFIVLAQYKGLPQIYPEEAVITNGVIANIDFSGVIAGETEPREGMVGKGYDLVIGSGGFLPGFDEMLIGKMKSQTATFDLAYPADYAVPELAGLTATWTVVINLIKTNSEEAFKTVVSDSRITSYPADLYASIEQMDIFDTEYLRKSYCRRWLVAKAILAKEGVAQDNPSYQAVELAILSTIGNYASMEEAAANGYSSDLIHYYVDRYLACRIIEENFLR